MDTNIKPCENFAKYACGDWERENAGLLTQMSNHNRFMESEIKVKKYVKGKK